MTTSRITPSVPIGALRTDDLTNVVVFKDIYGIVKWNDLDETIAGYSVYSAVTGLYLGEVNTLEELKEYANV